MSVLDQFRLDGDVALVTGAAGGIGTALAEAMAEAGADVALVDIDEESLDETAAGIRETADGSVLEITADVSEQAATERMVEETVESLGGLDVAFANAGVADFGGSPARYSMDTWDRILSVNLRGAFMTDRAVAGAMQTDGGGSIINTASILGLTGTQVPGLAAYSASKGGVIQVTRQFASELGRHGIRVNAIAPGWINTAMTTQAIPEGEAGEPLRQQLVDGIPLGRLGEPEDLAGVALYLASDASRYTTGEVHLVDGGMFAME